MLGLILLVLTVPYATYNVIVCSHLIARHGKVKEGIFLIILNVLVMIAAIGIAWIIK